MTDLSKIESELNQFRHKLNPAFSPETALPGTESQVPSAGHCAVVAYLVYRTFGGAMVSSTVQERSHWFNRLYLPSGVVDVDLTGDQFGLPPVLIKPEGSLFPGTRIRRQSELNGETADRAKRLREKMVDYASISG